MPSFPRSILLCPVCRDPLLPEAAPQPLGSTNQSALHLLWCRHGHRFDAARQGYFNLLTGRGTGFEADTAEMVQARIDFLGTGHFLPLAEAVCATAKEFAVDHPVVLDAGAGTGFYLGVLQQRMPATAAIALDISKFALRRAARLMPDVLCLVWDVWRPLPLADASMDLLLNIFAPRNPAEFARVLRDGGTLLVVTPLPHHLQEIAGTAGLLGIRAGKDDDVIASLSDSFGMVAARIVQFTMDLSPIDVRNVAMMGPAGHHHAPVELSTLPGSLPVTAAFTVQAFRRRPRPGG